jgi:hypothetical protein
MSWQTYSALRHRRACLFFFLDIALHFCLFLLFGNAIGPDGPDKHWRPVNLLWEDLFSDAEGNIGRYWWEVRRWTFFFFWSRSLRGIAFMAAEIHDR